MQGLGFPAGYEISRATAVSGDGLVAAGAAYKTNYSSGVAVRWSPSGVTALGLLPGTTRSFAIGVSEDGNVVVGSTTAGSDGSIPKEGFRWTESQCMIGLGLLPGGTYSGGAAASRDGSVIVGFADNNRGQMEPAIWDTAHGLRDLRTVLQTDYGLTVTASLGGARGISPDGSVIIGDGPDGAWIATIPEPPIGLLGGVGPGLVLWLARRKREPS